MGSKIKVHILDKNGEKVEKHGPFNDKILLNWWIDRTSAEQGETKITFNKAHDIASDLYPLLTEINLPEQLDDINSVSALNSINSISSICQLFIRYKENNRKFSGFIVVWG